MKYIQLKQNCSQFKCKYITPRLLLSEITTEGLESHVILIFVAVIIFVNHVYSVSCRRF